MSEEASHGYYQERQAEKQGNNELLHVEYVGMQREFVRGKEVTLHEQKITIDTQALSKKSLDELYKTNGLESEIDDTDIEFLKKFKKIDITVWTSDKLGDNWLDRAKNPNACTALLASGLAANKKQWQNHDASFVHNLADQFSTKLKPEWGEDLSLAMAAIACPGFGGTELADSKNVKQEDVSDKTYARLCDTVDRLMKISSLSVGVGHSAGAEAMLQLATSSEYKFNSPVVALNPAVWITESDRFKIIAALSSLNGKVQSWLPVAAVQEMIVRHLLSVPLKEPLKSEAERSQINIHIEEIEKNRSAFIAKCYELSQPDQIDQSKLRVKKPTLSYISKEDFLTQSAQQQTYLDAAVIKSQLEQSGFLTDYIDSQDMEKITQKFRDDVVMAEGGHDNIFIDTNEQDKAVNLVIRQFEQSLLLRDPLVQDMREILTYLHDHKFPIHVTYDTKRAIDIAHLVHQKEDEESTDFQMQRRINKMREVETMCHWVEAEKAFLKLYEENQSEESEKILLPADEVKQIVYTALVTNANRKYLLKENIIDQHGNWYTENIDDAAAEILYGSRSSEDFELLEHNHLNDWLDESSVLHRFKTVIGAMATRIAFGRTITDKNGRECYSLRKEDLVRSQEKPLSSALEKVKPHRARAYSLPVNSDDIATLYAINT